MKYFVCCLLLLNSNYSFAQLDTVSNLSNTEKIYGLSLFWKEASYNFAYFDKAKINWDSTYQAFIPQVLDTKSTYQYYRVLQKVCALLKDGHTNICLHIFRKEILILILALYILTTKFLILLYQKRTVLLCP